MSEAGSWTSRGSGSTAAQDPERLNKPGEDELDEAASLLQGVFGVLYVVSKEQERASWRFVAFRLLADVLQLFLLIFNSAYGWDFDGDNPGWKAVSFIGLNWIISSRGYTFFLATLYIMVFALCIVVALCIWVGWSFKNSRFDYVWPITVLRWYGKIFFQILDIASMSLFLIAMDCGYFGVANQYFNQEFPDQACFQMPHLIHLVVAAGSLVLFIGMAITYQVADMELNPLSKNLIAMGHSKADVQGFMLRAFMTVANVFVTDTRWLSIFYLGASVVLVYLYYKWIPHLHAWVNHVRVASYAAIAWSSFLFVIVAFARGDDDSAANQRSQATIALYAGIIPAACLGGLASWLRTRHFMVTVLNKFKSADPGTKSHLIYRFVDPREAEILVRCCRSWSPLDPELVEPQGVELAERIIKVGLEQMGKAPYMVILHSSFLIDVQSSYQSGYAQLQSAKRMDPSFLERFAIFSREQQHTQQSSSSGDGGNANLVSYVEFQKNYRLVLRSHREALVALRTFWTHLMHDNTKLLNLTRDVQRIDQSIRQAEAVYKMILNRHAANVKILRLYARFLEGVKHDPWSAAKWFMEADKLEQQEEDAKNGNMLSELGLDLVTAGGAGGLQELGALLNMKGGILGTHDTRAVFIINAQCIIQVTNPTVQKVFGWSKTEIKGKNISIIIPPPFAEMHTQFVRAHVASGKEYVIGHDNQFIALHKERHVVPVSLSVTKISGIGEDMLFMGVVEPLPVEPNRALAWVMLGSQAVVSVDPCFTDFFGFKPEELLGAQLEDWLVEPEKAKKVLAAEQADTLAIAARFANKPAPANKRSKVAERVASSGMMMSPAGSTNLDVALSKEYEPTSYCIKGLQVRHRYADPLTVNCTIKPGWIGSHRYLQLQLEQTNGAAMTAICDKHGKLVHVTEALAVSLGTTPKQLMQNGAPAAMQAMMPQVFATLHNAYIPMGLPFSLPPLHSCRTGQPVLLNMHARHGPPAPKPFKISISKKEGDLNVGDLSIVQLKELTMDQALSERRWKLVLDSSGRCVHVLSGDETVFGFTPQELLGTTLGDFLDVFRGQYLKPPTPDPKGSAAAVHGTRPVSVAETHKPRPPSVAQPRAASPISQDGIAGLELVPHPPSAPVPPSPSPVPHGVASAFGRITSNTHDMFRKDTDLSAMDDMMMEEIAGTGDLPGKEMEKVLLILAAKAHRAPRTSFRVGVMQPGVVPCSHPAASSEPLSALGGLLGAAAARPAIMTVSVKAKKAGTTKGGRRLVDTLSRKLVTSGDKQGEAPAEEDAINAALMRSGGMLFVVELWRADLATGVVEVDASGTITHSTSLPLYPPGLLFGAPESSLLGAHISTLLPQVTPGTPVGSLFEPGFGGVLAPVSMQEAAARRQRGNLKVAEKSSRRMPGPVNLMTTLHKTDGEALEVAVQAVHKLGPGPAGGVYLIIRPLAPVCGRTDFCQFIIRQQQEEVAAAAASQQAIRTRRSGALGSSLGEPLISSNTAGASSGLPAGPYTPGGAAGGHGKHHGPARRASSRALLIKPGGSHTPSHLVPAPPTVVQEMLMRQGTSGLPQPPMVPGGGRIPSITAPSPLGHMSLSPPAVARITEEQDIAEVPVPDPKHKPPSGSGLADDRIVQWVSNLPDSEGSGGNQANVSDNSNRGHPLDPLDSMFVHQPFKTGQDVAAQRPAAAPGAADAEEEEEGMEGPEYSEVADSVHDHDPDNGNGQTPSDSELMEPGAAVEDAGRSVQETDYKRGQRFKRLQRMLLSRMAQRPVERFRVHAYSAIVITLAVNLGLFVLQLMLIDQQKSGVNDLYSVGVAARLGIRIANLMRPLGILYGDRGLPTLAGLTNDSDIATIKANLYSYGTQMEYLHQGVYLGFGKHRTLPDDYGLRSLWEDPTLIEVVFEDTVPVLNYTRNASLWDVGNRFNARVMNIWQISDLIDAANMSFWDWAEVQYVVTNGQSVMAPAYRTTMDDFLSIAIDSAHSINGIQLIVLILEGIFVGVLSLGYMWLMGAQVMWQRYRMFNVFIMVPVGIVRALSTTPIILDEDDDEDVDALAETAIRGDAGKGEGKGDAKETVIKLHLDPELLIGVAGAAPVSLGQRLGRALGCLMLSKQKRGSSKRRLTTSIMFILWLVWPFMLWTVISVSLNVIAYNSLTTADSPIAVFNLINSAASYFQRTMYFAQELCVSTDPKYRKTVRTSLGARYTNLKTDWGAALYGGNVVPNSTLPRYTLAQQGIIASGGQGNDILFSYTGCLRMNQTGCFTPDSPFYQWTNNGLDRLMNFYFDVLEQLINGTDTYPAYNGWEFQFLWEARSDMQDGLQRATDAFFTTVNDVYNFSYNLLIAKFALSCTISLCIYLFILRPFLANLRNEARRVAELLCQLPPDIAVEQMVGQALGLFTPSSSSSGPGGGLASIGTAKSFTSALQGGGGSTIGTFKELGSTKF